MNIWKALLGRMGSGIREVRDAPNLAESSVQFGDRVRVLPDESTKARGLVGKIGTVYGQTTPSVTNPTIIGTPQKDYAVSVFFGDLGEQLWLPEHVLEFVDHGACATITLDGVDKAWTRNADGTWSEQ
jgi:hypothetical protein